MLPGTRNRLRKTRARHGGKAIDTETTSEIPLRIRIVQQFAIVEHDGGKFGERDIADRPARVLADWRSVGHDVGYGALFPDEFPARLHGSVQSMQMPADFLANASARAQPAMGAGNPLGEDVGP